MPSFDGFPRGEVGRVFDGLRLEHRWSGWDRAPFGATSTSQVAVYRKP